MDLTNTLPRCVTLIFIFMVLSPRNGISKDVSGVLDRVSASGLYLRIYETDTVTESCGECALKCVGTKSDTPMCQGFSCDPSDRTCHLYTKGDYQLTSPGDDVFIFKDTYHEVQINGYEFSIYISSDKKTYSEARTHCQDRGGYLLQFDSLDEYDAVKMVIITSGHNEAFFVGANDIDNEGIWVTDRENTVIDNSTWRWFSGEPNNESNEDCAVIVFNRWGLNDIECSAAKRFLCEKDTQMFYFVK